MIQTVLLTLLLSSIGADAKKSEPKQARDQLRGTWKVVSGESNGKAAPEDGLKGALLIFTRDIVTANSPAGKSSQLTFKLDAGKSPKTIDLINPKRKQTLLGIYQLKGDQLTLCLSSPGGSRPKEFKTKEGTDAVMFILQRQK